MPSPLDEGQVTMITLAIVQHGNLAIGDRSQSQRRRVPPWYVGESGTVTVLPINDLPGYLTPKRHHGRSPCCMLRVVVNHPMSPGLIN